jgi:hypothetical protein
MTRLSKKENEMENELFRQLFDVVKGVVKVQAKHQEQLEGMFRSYRGLLAVLSGQDEGEESTPVLSAAQEAALAKAKLEIEELERLFSREKPESLGGETL